MAKLNKRARRQILDTLDSSVFTSADFETSYPEDNGALVSIAFHAEPSYSLVLQKPNYSNEFKVSFTPGTWMETAEIEAKSFDDCLKAIANWCSYIRADLRSNAPWAKELDALRSSFDEAIRNHLDDPDKYFTREEAADVQARLDDLLAKFDILRERNAVTEEQLDLVRAEIEAIKKNAATFTKGTFFKTMGNKLLVLMGKVAASKPAQEVLTEVTRRALGYGQDHH